MTSVGCTGGSGCSVMEQQYPLRLSPAFAVKATIGATLQGLAQLQATAAELFASPVDELLHRLVPHPTDDVCPCSQFTSPTRVTHA